MKEIVDIAIIGSGPAGISAALNAKIRNKSFILFGAGSFSGKVQRSELIRNYPGQPDITGADLNRQFAGQLEKMDISVTEKRITGIYKMGAYFALLADREAFDARTVIIATGVETARPVEGERRLLGRGVSYCATCDGNLYRDKTIAVVCDNAAMEEEVAYLAGLAGKVYYFPLFKGSTLSGETIEKIASPVTEIIGEARVEAVRCKDGSERPVDGIFFIKQSVSPEVLLNGLAMEDGQIIVDRQMATNILGCFAAGDCTGAPYQIAKAVGEGNIAAHSAVRFLSQ